MRVVRTLAIAVAVALAVLAAIDGVFARAFPHFDRLADDFSAHYLVRTLDGIDTRTTVYVGDSTLWGYGVPAPDAAVTRLRARGYDDENLSYEGGSPANTFAMLRLLFAAGVRPKIVVFNVNLKEFNASDSAYRRLYPEVEALAWPLLERRQRERLTSGPKPDLDARIDAALARVWSLYGMRSDLRYALFGDVDAAHAVRALLERLTGAAARRAAAERPTPDRFEGTYDLAPLASTNVSLAFLDDTIELLRKRRIRAYAILTPTNHALLGESIDGPAYRANLALLRGRLVAGNVHVLDYDDRFAGRYFIDNDHLTSNGNAKLAALLARDIAP